MNGALTACWYLKPYSGREHTVFINIQSADDDYEKIGKTKKI